MLLKHWPAPYNSLHSNFKINKNKFSMIRNASSHSLLFLKNIPACSVLIKKQLIACNSLKLI